MGKQWGRQFRQWRRINLQYEHILSKLGVVPPHGLDGDVRPQGQYGENLLSLLGWSDATISLGGHDALLPSLLLLLSDDGFHYW